MPGGPSCAVQCREVQYITVQICSVQYRTVQCGVLPCSAVQCSAVQCSAVQCSAVQCSAAVWVCPPVCGCTVAAPGHIRSRRGQGGSRRPPHSTAPRPPPPTPPRPPIGQGGAAGRGLAANIWGRMVAAWRPQGGQRGLTSHQPAASSQQPAASIC